SFPSIDAAVDRVRKEGVVLDPDQLAAIAVFAADTLSVVDYLRAAAGETGAVDRVTRLIGDPPNVGRVSAHLLRFVDPDGSIRERDIPALKNARDAIARAQQDLQKSAHALANRDDLRRYWSTDVATQRNGRTVLPLKADHRGKVRGIVHEVSSTGATVFIEPDELVARNNAVVEAENHYRNELLRVLRELSAFCREHHADIAHCRDFMVRLDLVVARARYSAATDSVAATESRSVRLVAARHPLLGGAAVPIGVEIAEPTRVLIVTGPNTGGKTVSLKTIGLFALMNQFGLHVPASEGTELPVFSAVYADIGDEQSIEQNLSTFSGHMRNIGRLLHQVDERSLVLLDELGSGTDPEEGGALAMAIIDELLKRRPITVVTTHHGRLKHYGFTHDDAANASVEFDPQSLRPTYRIIPGVPGSSHAIDVAAQMGLLRSVTADARRYLTGEEYDTGTIIRRLTTREQELHGERQQIERVTEDLERERERLHAREGELDRRERALRSARLHDLDEWAAETRSKLENLVRELREGELTREKTQSVKAFIAELSDRIDQERASNRHAPAAETPTLRPTQGRQDGPPHDAIGVGTPVRVRSSGQKGIVQRKGKKGSWVVQVGTLRLPVAEDDLELLAERSGPERPYAATYAVSGGVSSRHAVLELDVRGYRLDDAIRAVDDQIDAALVSGLHEFGIIHGMGEGILQSGIRAHLGDHHHVSAYDYARPEDGGFGKTHVSLRRG
ncbi:MAG: endonuclease MutS2, partial [Spirochaetaceae bacterium]